MINNHSHSDKWPFCPFPPPPPLELQAPEDAECILHPKPLCLCAQVHLPGSPSPGLMSYFLKTKTLLQALHLQVPRHFVIIFLTLTFQFSFFNKRGLTRIPKQHYMFLAHSSHSVKDEQTHEIVSSVLGQNPLYFLTKSIKVEREGKTGTDLWTLCIYLCRYLRDFKGTHAHLRTICDKWIYSAWLDSK